MVTKASSRRHPHPVSTGAMIVAMGALPGALFSVFLTLVKFRSAYRCDFGLLTACTTDCSAVLTSPLSIVLGAPLSVYSTAYFLAVLGLAGALLWRPGPFLATARPLLFVFAWAGLAAIAGLAGYAFIVVGGFCQYCMVIYGLTSLVFLGVSLMHTQGHRQGLRSLFSRRLLQSSTLTITGLSFLALVSVQMVWYRVSAVELRIDAQCVVDRGHLPDTALQTPAPGKPRVKIALFVDLACHFCREEYEIWRAYTRTHPEEVQLAVFHYPRANECLSPLSPSKNPNAEKNRSCSAARAVECVEAWQEGKGLEMIDALFQLQDQSAPFFTGERLAEEARRLGFPEIPEDLAAAGSLDAPFFRCINDPDSESLIRIREHARFGAEQQIVETPASLLIFFDQRGAPRPSMVRIRGAKEHGDPDATLRAAEEMVNQPEPSTASG